MKAHISDEQGNVGLIGIILASVVGVTGLVLQNQAQKTSTKMAMTQIERAVDTIEMRNASQLSRTLGLFSVGGGRTVPAVYPVNYFDSSWQLSKQAGLNIVGMTLNSPTQIQLAEALNNFSNQTTVWGQSSRVDLIQPIVDPNHPYHATSLAVKITGQDSGKTDRVKVEYARIPLDMPKGRNPVLQIFDSGAYRPVVANEIIQSGNQSYRIVADGVVLDARVSLNGATFLERVAGFDGQGKPRSGAFNPAGIAQTVGAFTADFVAMVNPMSVPDWGNLDQYSDGGDSCTILNFPPPGGSATPTSSTISVELRSVNDEYDAGTALNVPIKLADGFKASVEGNQDLHSDEAFIAACPQACEYYGVTQSDIDWVQPYRDKLVEQFQSGIYRPMFSWTGKGRPGQAHYIGGPYHICASAEKLMPLAPAQYHKQSISQLTPDEVVDAIMNPDSPIAHLQEQIAYDYNDCKPHFVVTRSSCGCFVSMTKIQLADGSQKEINQLTETDLVYNPITKKSYSILNMIQGPENKPLYVIEIGSDQVEVTEEHPFPTRRGLMPASALKIGDEIADGSGAYRAIGGIQLKSYDEAPVVWNLELKAGTDPDDHYVLADGIVTGDLYLQKMLKNK